MSGLRFPIPTDFYPVTDELPRPSKVRPPALRDDILARPRLLDWLDAKIHRRVVAIVAEAGYGKTTLLADWSRRTRIRTAWYRLDDDDHDVITFIRYLLAACREVAPELGAGTASMLRDIGGLAVPSDVLVDTFLRELVALGDEPAAIILDDVHSLDGAPEVLRVLRELVARAPDRVTIVLSGRKRPPVALARLRTLGELAELSADDLRFDHDETEALFRDAYHQPLDRETLTALETRTEGWAASLNTVHVVTRDRSDFDARRFIRGLSAAAGPLYDYLAEEVLVDLDDGLQWFLMCSAVLEDVTPDTAAAAAAISVDEAAEYIGECARLGLLSRPTVRSAQAGSKYHPLVREFLIARLMRDGGAATVQEVHRRVARLGEASDWRLATHHHAEAGDAPSVHRTLVSATRSIMAAGDYAYAEALMRRFPVEDDLAWFDIVLSRRDLQAGSMDAAVARASRAAAAFREDGPDRQLALANLMSVHFFAGNHDSALQSAHAVLESDADSFLRSLAHSTMAMVTAGRGGNLASLREHFRSAAALQRGAPESHYLGVTMLNLACANRAIGDAEAALRDADVSIAALADSAASLELCSAHLVRGWALAHLGRIEEAEHALETARPLGQHTMAEEYLAEAADVVGTYMDVERAERMLRDYGGEKALSSAAGAPMLAITRSENSARLGFADEARLFLRDVAEGAPSADLGHLSRLAAARAMVALVAQDPGARILAERGVEVARRQGAEYWAWKSKLIQVAADRDADAQSGVISQAARQDSALLTAFSEIVAPLAADLDPVAAEAVATECRARPGRWRHALREVVRSGSPAAAVAASKLLEPIGEASDVLLIKRAGRRHRVARELDPLARRLARQLAPVVVLHDLGRVSMHVGSHRVPGSTMRRKVLSLLCFLASRQGLAATRDQVLDALWPDLTPELGSNSLNQTVYFLRRVIEPNYADETSPGYVLSDQEMVWLDPELVSTASQRCTSLLRRLATTQPAEAVFELAECYEGRFALDFTYEDWAASFRDSLHARYLEVMERTISRLSEGGQYSDATRLAHRVLEVDPTAETVELAVIRLYRSAGSFAAAAEQYAHYSALLRSEFGAEPPPLNEL